MKLFSLKKRESDKDSIKGTLKELRNLNIILSEDNVKQVKVQFSKLIKSVLSTSLDINQECVYEEFILYINNLGKKIKELDNQITALKKDITNKYNQKKKDKKIKNIILSLKQKLNKKNTKQQHLITIKGVLDKGNIRNNLFYVLKRMSDADYGNREIEQDELKRLITGFYDIIACFAGYRKTSAKNIFLIFIDKILLIYNGIFKKDIISGLKETKIELDDLISKAGICIKNEDYETTRKLYIEIFLLYYKLLDDEKQHYHDQITSLYNDIIHLREQNKYSNLFLLNKGINYQNK